MNHHDTRPVQNALETLYATGYWLLSCARTQDAAKVFRAMTLAAPRDERSWVALATCHEELEQDSIALELYGLGALAAAPSPRCWIAKARLLRKHGRIEDAAFALTQAGQAALEAEDDDARVICEEEMRHAHDR